MNFPWSHHHHPHHKKSLFCHSDTSSTSILSPTKGAPGGGSYFSHEEQHHEGAGIPHPQFNYMIRTDIRSTCNLFLSERAQTFTVNVTCKHDDDICVYFFGHPCTITPACERQYVTCLGQKEVKGCLGSKATFTYEAAFFAACRSLYKPAGECQSSPLCLQNCKIRSKRDKTGDACDLHFDDTDYPCLSDPRDARCVENGCFEINTPFFCKDSCEEGLGIGLGGIACKEYQMCSYVEAEPGTKYEIKPIPKFYIALGRYEKGECVPFYKHILNDAAVCNVSGGVCDFNVCYTSDCEWTVNGIKCKKMK